MKKAIFFISHSWLYTKEGLLVAGFACFFEQGFRNILKDQDQDSLLVKRRNDNHSPGPVIRGLVPSFHQRSELSNTILCIFSG